MSAAQPLDVNEAIDSIAHRKAPMAVIGGGLALAAIGLGAFVFGLTQDAVWAWGAALVGIIYVLGLSMGGLMFSVICTLTWARWSRPLKRVSEAFALFLPIAWVILLVILVAGIKVYPWHPETIVASGPVPLEPHSKAVLFTSKPVWLTSGFFIVRQVIGVGLMALLGFLYVRASLRPDLILARARLGDSRVPGWWASVFGASAGDVQAAVASGQKTQSTLGPILGVLYALVMSMVAFDMIMSLSPWWYSNMFGGWFFASSFWLAMQALGVYVLVGRDWLGLRGWVKPKTMHDLGKLILAFTMAWAYMLYAQLLPIWYANMPEETDFIMIRLFLPQWAWLSHTVAVLCFLMPFTVLVSRGIKKMRWPFAAFLSVMMIGVFLERTVLVMPSIYLGEEFPVMLFAVVSIGVWLGFVGLFFAFVTWILSNVPTLPVSDPKLPEHPWDVHVHSLDSTHSGELTSAH